MLGRTVGELEATISWNELLEWRDMYPFWPQKQSIQLAVLSSMYASAHGKPGRKPPGPQEFMIEPAEDKRDRKTATFISFLTAIAKPKDKANV